MASQAEDQPVSNKRSLEPETPIKAEEEGTGGYK